MSKFILIMWIGYHYTSGPISSEFKSMSACEAAGKEITSILKIEEQSLGNREFVGVRHFKCIEVKE